MAKLSNAEHSSEKGKGVEATIEGDEQVYHNPKSQVRLQQPLIDRVSKFRISVRYH
jgi:hypothetical protein